MSQGWKRCAKKRICMAAYVVVLMVSLFSSSVFAFELSDLLLEKPRKILEDKGVSFRAVYDGDMVTNISGGLHRGTTYLGKLAMGLTLDLGKAGLVPGGIIYVSGQHTYGGARPSIKYIGDMQGADNIEAPTAMRLYECWYEQNFFQEKISLLAGTYDVNSEFAVSKYGSLFLQSSFGMPPDMSVNVHTSIFPVVGLGARVKVKPIEQLEFLAGVFDGDPTDDGRNKYGTRFQLSSHQGLMAIVEGNYYPGIRWNDSMEPLPGNIKFGSWLHTAHVDDVLAIDDNGSPITRRGDYGFYGGIDQLVFQEIDGCGPSGGLYKLFNLRTPVTKKGDMPCGLGVFLQFGGAPDARNTLAYYLGAGMSYTGLFPCREGDVLGIGVANAFLSPMLRKARNRDIDTFDPADPAAGQLPGKLQPNESALETTYRIELNDHAAIQPSYQIIFSPNGEKDVENAHVLILRFEATF